MFGEETAPTCSSFTSNKGPFVKRSKAACAACYIDGVLYLGLNISVCVVIFQLCFYIEIPATCLVHLSAQLLFILTSDAVLQWSNSALRMTLF